MANNDDINVNQLKEFMEFRADQQDTDIGKISAKLDTFVSDTTSILSKVTFKVDLIWKIGSLIALALSTAILKSLGIL